MRYPPEAIHEIDGKRGEVIRRLQSLRVRVVAGLAPKLNEDAKEYALQGIGRRIGILEQCIENIFDTFPVVQERPLSRIALNNVQINLHAFIINLTGLLDNLAWTFVLQNELQIHPLQIGLFKANTIAVLPERIRAYLAQEDTQRWHTTYAKDYRDSLAHRIPLYVPPSQITQADDERLRELERLELDLIRTHKFEEVDRVREEKDGIGFACPYFVHSINHAAPVVLHPQLLSDAMTVAELVDMFLAELMTA